jgi:hypothetical protein
MFCETLNLLLLEKTEYAVKILNLRPLFLLIKVGWRQFIKCRKDEGNFLRSGLFEYGSNGPPHKPVATSEVSVKVFPNLKQNFTQTRCSSRSFIFQLAKTR